MKDSLVEALESMLALQRWNFLPRVETWVEAENAAYVTHVGYALARAGGFSSAEIDVLVRRSLLRSLNKHYLTDISVEVRDRLKKENIDAWRAMVDATAVRTSRLFPRTLAAELLGYLTDEPSYAISGSDSRKSCARVESLFKFAQYAVAKEECEVNSKIYAEDYRHIVDDLARRLSAAKDASAHDAALAGLKDYLRTIKRLKYLRRWNRINRVLSTSVMGHTYLAAVLAIVAAMLSREEWERRQEGAGKAGWPRFLHTAMLRALFHDVPESVTGDIITPVKAEIQKHDPALLQTVERELTGQFILSAPPPVREDMESMNLVAELDNRETYSVDSLVKDCDRLALLLECIYERGSNVRAPEIEGAFTAGLKELTKSEWSAVRNMAGMAREHWEAAG